MSTCSPTSDPASCLADCERGDEVAHVKLLDVLTAFAGAKEARFNKGFYFLSQAAEAAGDVAGRLAALVAHSSDGDLVRLATRRAHAAGMPLRLLEAARPDLRPLLFQRMLSAPAGKQVALMHGIWDGLHLSTAGLAGLAVPWVDGADMVTVPIGLQVLMAPVNLVHTSKEGGGLSPARLSAPVDEVVNSHQAPTSLILERWPHLPRLLGALSAEEAEECREYLQQMQAAQLNLPPLPPAPLQRLISAHSNNIRAASCSVLLTGESCVVTWLCLNSAFGDLFRIGEWDAVSDLKETGDSQRFPLWMHPAATMRRCLAFLAARNMGMASFQFEGQYLRLLRPEAFDKSMKPVEYLPFYAVESVYEEKSLGGHVIRQTTYITDILPGSGPVTLGPRDLLNAQLEVMEGLALAESSQPLEVAMAVRRSGSAQHAVLEQAVDDTEILHVSLRMLLLALGGLRLAEQAPAQELLTVVPETPEELALARASAVSARLGALAQRDEKHFAAQRAQLLHSLKGGDKGLPFELDMGSLGSVTIQRPTPFARSVIQNLEGGDVPVQDIGALAMLHVVPVPVF